MFRIIFLPILEQRELHCLSKHSTDDNSFTSLFDKKYSFKKSNYQSVLSSPKKMLFIQRIFNELAKLISILAALTFLSFDKRRYGKCPRVLFFTQSIHWEAKSTPPMYCTHVLKVQEKESPCSVCTKAQGGSSQSFLVSRN